MTKILLFLSAVSLSFLTIAIEASQPTVINFDNLNYNSALSGTNYAGLNWEFGNAGPSGNPGQWKTPPSPETLISYPHSQPYCATNAWGSTLMGIGFASSVNVIGAYFAGGGSQQSYFADAVRIHGYLGGSEVAVTSWFSDIDIHSDWFAINLNNVDRIVIEADPVPGGGGFYDIDDLTYTEVPEPATLLLLGLGGLLIRKNRK